jgi:hypothetical protein
MTGHFFRSSHDLKIGANQGATLFAQSLFALGMTQMIYTTYVLARRRIELYDERNWAMERWQVVLDLTDARLKERYSMVAGRHLWL